jgi:hypothetical protein
MLPSVIAQMSPEEDMGARLGAFLSLFFLPSLIGAPVDGALIHRSTREEYVDAIRYAVDNPTVISIRVKLKCTLIHRPQWISSVIGSLPILMSRLLHD